MPCRIVFDGDIVESIRYFDIENQLSEKELKKVSITPDITGIESDFSTSFFANIPEDSILVFKDTPLVLDRMDDVFKKSEEFSSDHEMVHIADRERLFKDILNFSIVETGNYFHFKDM